MLFGVSAHCIPLNVSRRAQTRPRDPLVERALCSRCRTHQRLPHCDPCPVERPGANSGTETTGATPVSTTTTPPTTGHPRWEQRDHPARPDTPTRRAQGAALHRKSIWSGKRRRSTRQRTPGCGAGRRRPNRGRARAITGAHRPSPPWWKGGCGVPATAVLGTLRSRSAWRDVVLKQDC